jgi:hypothetical protein
VKYGIALLLLASTLEAHHATNSMYDAGKVITMQGVVSEVQWMNPHAHFNLDVIEAGGTAVKWDVELPSPNVLVTQGWKKNDLRPGDRVTVEVWAAKNGDRLANARTVVLPDGRTLSGKSVWDGPLSSFLKK